jgi:predicted PurR-regulated permease PerM
MQKHGVRVLTGILVLLVIGFCFAASSVCITVVLAGFLAILVDPVVSALERIHVRRPFAAAATVLLGVLAVGSVAYVSYGKLTDFFDDFPRYLNRIGDAISPISSKIQRVEDSAGKLANEAAPKRVPEVRVRETTSWASYLARGVGSASGALVVAGFVPFLMYFMLVARRSIYLCIRSMAGDGAVFDRVVDQVNAMVRTYIAGNLVIGALLSTISIIVFWQVGLDAAVLVGILSGMLNVIPFLGIIPALFIPLVAGAFQLHGATPFVEIAVTVTVLHLVAANFLLPRYVGPQLDISPVAATIGFLFWGWLWGVAGLLLAVPLTALVKALADCNPALGHISNLLAREPRNFLFSKKQPVMSHPDRTAVR